MTDTSYCRWLRVPDLNLSWWARRRRAFRRDWRTLLHELLCRRDREIVPDDRKISAVSESVRAYASNPDHAEALRTASERMVGERF
jgi:hypothetical protein